MTGTDGVSFPQSIVYIFAWNGQGFSILGMKSISALRQLQSKDIDGNGTKEVILVGGNPTCISCSDFLPQRERTISLTFLEIDLSGVRSLDFISC